MLDSEVRQLELLSSIDDLRQRTQRWVTQSTEWEPEKRAQSLLRRVLDRVETLRIRMESPLVVATFGGTGTGKSSLVNALLGEEVTRSGRQRPTTLKPVLIAHPQTALEDLGIPLEEVDVIRREGDLLQDVIVLDCPDPDTTEGDTTGSNLDRLRTLLPYCDVLLYVSTQQKYRSARVSEELRSAASGCRIIFVQTHAGLDEDIRDDWRRTLSGEFEVPEVFFVDSLRALEERQAGQRPSGEMGRLIDLLGNRFGASERVRVRRANVVDLLQAGLARCRELLEQHTPALDQLQSALGEQNLGLSRRMAKQLEDDLLASHNLWERRLLSAVTERWGMSPFSIILRIYNGLGGIVASMTLARARSTAQLAILGTVQGVRWLEGRRKEQAAESVLHRVSHFGLDDAILRESEIVIEGHLTSAGFPSSMLRSQSLDTLRQRAADVESEFVGDASQRVDEIIHELAGRNSRAIIRGWYELLFGVYLGFVLYRVGRNFFVDSFLFEAPLFSSDFYLAATLFFVLWAGALIILFTRRLRFGLTDRIRTLVSKMVQTRLGRGLFPQLEDAVGDARRSMEDIQLLFAQTSQLRHDLAGVDDLGGRSRQFPKVSQGPVSKMVDS
ncbi:MAG: GTPase domain-containing protein [Planctomycetaceae bacterium]|nr:GTPase domain-containing protein [Planctomycetaceae bacterium]